MNFDSTIPLSSILLAAGFFLGYFLLYVVKKDRNIHQLVWSYIIITICIILFVKVGYFLFYSPSSLITIYEFTKFNENNSILGAMVIGILFFPILGKFFFPQHWKNIGDTLILSLTVWQVFGKIGCYFEHCCFGIVCEKGDFFNVWLAVSEGYRIPVQMYESLSITMSLVVYCIIYMKNKFLPGTICCLYFVFYGCHRFLFEFIRGDSSTYLGVLKVPQYVALVLMVVGTLLLVLNSRKNYLKFSPL